MRDPDKLHTRSNSSDSPVKPKVMTVPEVAIYLKLHPTTLYRLIRRKAVPAFRIGSDWRFNVEEIDVWLSELSGQAEGVVKRPSNDRRK